MHTPFSIVVDRFEALSALANREAEYSKGSKAVAVSEGIAHVRLSAESTTESYLAEFLGRRFIGIPVVESIHVSDSADAEVIRAKPDST